MSQPKSVFDKKMANAMGGMRILRQFKWSAQAREQLVRWIATGSTTGPLPQELALGDE